jgi:hypothetical protein
MRRRLMLSTMVAIGLALSAVTPALAAGVLDVGAKPQVVKGPTTNIVLGSAGNLHFRPSSLTVPDVGDTQCTVPNRSLHIVNRLTQPFWLTHSGAEVTYIPAHSTDIYCFYSAVGTYVFNIADRNGNPIPGSRSLSLDVT